MDSRKLENFKVLLRKNIIVYKISKFIYLPVELYKKFVFQKELKGKIKVLENRLLSLDSNVSKVFYFGVPIHENLGDAAQMMCIRRWICLNYPSYELVEIESYPTYDKNIRTILERMIKSTDVIITESGATFCNRHQDHGVHRYLLDTFKSTPIYLMPQTVELPDEKEMLMTAKLFNSNQMAIFLARDPESYKMVSNYFNMDRVMLYPDIVTTLIGNYKSDQPRTGILVCKRIDGEKKYTDYAIKDLLTKISRIDVVDMTDTNFDHSLEYTYNHLEEEIQNKLDMFARYKVILTDRYHGMIFSLIANTPVVVIPTAGHKVRKGAQWFKEDYPDGIYFCETLEEAYDTINNIMNDYKEVVNPSLYAEKYYSHLKENYYKMTHQHE